MELKASQIGSWTFEKPPSALDPSSSVAVLIFGQDEGGVQELSRSLVKNRDDMEVFDGSSLSTTLPDILSSLGSGSLFAPNPLILVRGVDDRQVRAVEQMVEAARGGDTRLVITAGDLKPASKTRKLFSSTKDVVSAPIYRMRGREISAYAKATLAELDANADPSALSALAERLPGDRALARRSCEVLALYAAGKNLASIGSAEVSFLLDDIDEAGAFAPLDLVLDGNTPAALRALGRRLDAGENAIGLLRAFGRRAFQIREILSSGKPAKDAVKTAKPPVFWAEQDAMIRRVARTDIPEIDRILRKIDLAEKSITEEGARPGLVLSRLLVSGPRSGF